MKISIAGLLFFLLASPAHAALPALAEGSYSYGGDLSVISKLAYHVVYGFTDAGRAELRRRESAGEECTDTGRDIYLCKQFAALGGAAGEVRDRVGARLQGQLLVLAAARGEPSLISQGEDVAEYEVPQQARFGGKTYDTYRLVNAQGNWSARLGDAVDAQFDFENGVPKLVFDVTVTHSRTAYDDYTVLAAFRRM